MKLAYQAFDKAGKAVSDTIDAATTEEATDQLRRRGLFVTSVNAADLGAPADAKPTMVRPARRMGCGRRLKNLAVFTRQLYVLLSTGTPMVETLGALERQCKDPLWRVVVADLRRRVEEGSSLSEAMAADPASFDQVFRSLVASGESGGKFDVMLDRLSQLTRKQLQTRSAVIGSLVYPSLLLVVSGGVLVLMLTFVLPRFGDLFKTMDLTLPPTTKVIMMISDVLCDYWSALILAAAVVVAALWGWARTPHGQLVRDTVMIRAPGVGAMTRSFITARIARLLGVLSDSHVPLLEALALTKAAAGNIHYRRLMDKAENAVTRGDPISAAFSDEKLISPSVYEAMRSGEATGRVSAMLINMADFMDEENEVLLKTLASILEPAILIGLGVLVGLVALSMFMPLFDLTAQMGS